MRGWPALVGLAGLAGCLTIDDPEPTLSISACTYFDACVPGFATTFQSVDTCIEALDEQPVLVNRCGVGLDTLESCNQQLQESISTCESIDQGACRSLVACSSLDCELEVASINDRCSDFELEPSVASGWCSVPAGACVVSCLGQSDCSVLENPNQLEYRVAICVAACDVF